jgi:tubulin-folding cofactor B
MRPDGKQNPDFIALRNFVTAQDHVTSSNVLKIDLTHSNLKQRHLEIRFDKNATLYDLRRRFYLATGTPHSDQDLEIFINECLYQEVPAALFPEDHLIPIQSLLPPLDFTHTSLRVHCCDRNPVSISARGALENTNLVEKFVLTEEQYEKRSNTLRSWCKQQQAQNPKFNLQVYAKQQQALAQAKMCYKRGLPLPEGFVVEDGQVKFLEQDEEDPEEVYNEASIQHALVVGARCQVTPGERRGRVAWTGRLDQKPGYWIGIVLDEPMGNNNGSLESVQYFECQDKHGCFVRGPNAQVGDFPERDIFDEEDSSDDEI